MPEPLAFAPPRTCLGCGSELSPAVLSCPVCHRLVYAEELKQLASQAEASARADDKLAALVAWRRALELLPAGSEQSKRIGERVSELSRSVESESAPKAPTFSWAKSGTALAAVALLVWKFKFLAVLALTKLKFLALGFTKMGTVFSMILSLGVYWTAWGWRFALGLVLSIYIHEMGHVAALRRFGVAASAPMFIPGFGALVRIKQNLASPREDARVGLAGPIWGLGATLATYALSLATGSALLAAIAKFGAWINLFNLLPVWQLDGGRGVAALTRPQRWGVVAACAVAWAVTREGLLVLIGLAAAFRAWQGDAPQEPDWVVLVQFCGLILSLALLASLPVAIPV